jgi:hypothetical protein
MTGRRRKTKRRDAEDAEEMRREEEEFTTELAEESRGSGELGGVRSEEPTL